MCSLLRGMWGRCAMHILPTQQSNHDFLAVGLVISRFTSPKLAKLKHPVRHSDSALLPLAAFVP